MRPSARLPAAIAAAIALALAVGAAGPAAAADLERQLSQRWQGAWVVIEVGVSSACTSAYTDNDVRGDLVTSKGDHRFAPGELAVVHKVDVFRGRVEVRLDLAEPLLEPFRDGPFTLYNELACRVEIQFERPGSWDRFEPLDARIAELLERHADERSARDSEGWNGRVRDPYPEDYDQTLAEHRAWQAAQTNAAIDARRDRALEEAARLVAAYDDDPDYVAGFSAGVDKARDAWWGGCDQLLDATVYGFVKSPPSGRSRSWKRGYEDGQTLVFHLEVGRRLAGCYVPAP